MKNSEPLGDSKNAGGYDPSFFADLALIEDRHFWFRARNRLIFELTRRISAGLKSGQDSDQQHAQECVRFGDLGHHLAGVGDTREQGPDPARHQPRVFLAGSRVSVHCSAHERPSVRTGQGTSRDLSQGSSGSHYRCYRTGRGAAFADCRPSEPSVQSGSGGLVRTLGDIKVGRAVKDNIRPNRNYSEVSFSRERKL